MLNNKFVCSIAITFSLCLTTLLSYAQPYPGNNGDGLGQTIQIYTRFHSFIGKTSWLLVIRDLDNNQNIPYLYDIRRGDNFWLAFTYGRNYVIKASTLQISTYNSRYNYYKKYKIHNFCNLESQGRIIRGQSLYITINGDLSTNSSTYSCHVSRYSDSNFSVAPQASDDP